MAVFPPGWGSLLVPLSSRRVALGGISAFSAVTLRNAALQQVARAAVVVLGPWVLPGKPVAWEPPTGHAIC